MIVKVQICIDMRRTIVVCGHLVWLLFHVYLLFRQPDKQVTYIILTMIVFISFKMSFSLRRYEKGL